jgi:hypothetical protein
MALRPKKPKWTPDKELAWNALYVKGMTPQQVYDAGIAGWYVIKGTIQLHDMGFVPPPQKPKGDADPQADGNVDPSKTEVPLPKPKSAVLATSNFGEASFVNVIPRAFTTTSTALWLAMEAAQKYWKWPEEMTPGQFLDRFLPQAFFDYGIVLLACFKLPGADVADEGANGGIEGVDKWLVPWMGGKGWRLDESEASESESGE